MSSGALVGAGGATAYYNGVDVSGTMRYLMTGGQLRDLPSWQSSGGNGRELDALYKLVSPKSLIQTLRAACIYPRSKGWDMPQEDS